MGRVNRDPINVPRPETGWSRVNKESWIGYFVVLKNIIIKMEVKGSRIQDVVTATVVTVTVLTVVTVLTRILKNSNINNLK